MKLCWTKEKCREEALKYTTRTEFRIKIRGAYEYARLNNFLDDVCSHMNRNHIVQKRCIYVVEFEDNHVYVGLTYNFNIRRNQHLNNTTGPVYKHMNKYHNVPIFKQLTDYLDEKIAQKKESFYVKLYKIMKYNILNTAPTGALGGNFTYWTKKRCKEETIKYYSKSELNKYSGTLYKKVLEYGWFDEMCSHMIELKKPNGYWTKERCQEEALKYETKKDFKKNIGSAYNSCLRNDWLDDVCSHMVTIKKLTFWTEERCHEESLKYETKKDFYKCSNSVYNTASKNGWLNEICSHMIELKKPNGYWDYSNCKNIAIKYNIRKDFEKNSGSAYNSAHYNGWIDEICSHMIELKKPNGYWTKERCQIESLKCKKRSDFKKNAGGAYNMAKKNKYLDEICSHMNKK